MSFGDGSSGSRSQLYYLIAMGSGQALKFSDLHLSHVSQENITTRTTGLILNEGLYLTVLSMEPARGQVPELMLQDTDQLLSRFASSLRVSWSFLPYSLPLIPSCTLFLLPDASI